jgi:hypothetical protein
MLSKPINFNFQIHKRPARSLELERRRTIIAWRPSNQVLREVKSIERTKRRPLTSLPMPI